MQRQSVVDFARGERERYDRIIDRLIELLNASGSGGSWQLYRQILLDLRAAEASAQRYLIESLAPEEAQEDDGGFLLLFRTNISAPIMVLAAALVRGDIPIRFRMLISRGRAGRSARDGRGGQQAATQETSDVATTAATGRPGRAGIDQLTSDDRQKIRDDLRKGLIRVTGKDGKAHQFETTYYLALTLHSKAGEVRKSAALKQAARLGTDLVQVSPQPSTIGDYCDLYRGRVFSISGTSAEFPPLSDCPNGGAPFHPWCHHWLIPVMPDSPEAYAARAMGPIPAEYLDLARRGGTPAEFMGAWRKP